MNGGTELNSDIVPLEDVEFWAIYNYLDDIAIADEEQATRSYGQRQRYLFDYLNKHVPVPEDGYHMEIDRKNRCLRRVPN